MQIIFRAELSAKSKVKRVKLREQCTQYSSYRGSFPFKSRKKNILVKRETEFKAKSSKREQK